MNHYLSLQFKLTRMQRLFVLIIALSLCVSLAEAEEPAQDKYQIEEYVYKLTSDTLQQAIDQFPVVMVKFFAPWCGHCKKMAPEYIELARSITLGDDHEYIIAEIDCTKESLGCSKHGVRGYPTLKLFVDGQSHQFSGSRTKDGILDWINNKVEELRSQPIEDL